MHCRGEKHYLFGKKHSEELKKKMGEARKGKGLGENNCNWKGDNVKYSSLHEWVRNHLPKPELCMLCKEKPPKELACITGIYNREFKNWAYFCHKCHKEWDNIIERNLKPFKKLAFQ